MSYLVGNDGSVAITGTVGTATANIHAAQFNVWNATFSRVVSDITGFGDYGRRRQLGVHDVSGSAGGFLRHDAGNTKPSLGGTAASATSVANWFNTGADIVLNAKGTGTTAGNCAYAFKAVISDGAITMTKTGDAAVSFNFALAGGQIPVEIWDES